MNNISKDKLLKRLNGYSNINRDAIKILNKKIAEYRLERANKHYWHNKMGIILNRLITNKESHEKVYNFFQKQISDLESGKKGTYLVLQEIRARFCEFDGGKK